MSNYTSKRKECRQMLVLLTSMLLLWSSDVLADIYSYVNEDGVSCFTDVPVNRGATIIMRDDRKRTSSSPSHLKRASGQHRNATGRQPAGGTFALPVQGRITSPVGLRQDPIDGMPRHHNGVDIAIPEGTAVRPVAPGVVTFSGVRSGYGNLVALEHPDGMITLYAHNSANLKNIGDEVDEATVIALSGSTGRSTGPHLHFEAWRDGINITSAFMPSTGELPQGGTQTEIKIRRLVQADGSLLFTNLPTNHP